MQGICGRIWKPPGCCECLGSPEASEQPQQLLETRSRLPPEGHRPVQPPRPHPPAARKAKLSFSATALMYSGNTLGYVLTNHQLVRPKEFNIGAERLAWPPSLVLTAKPRELGWQQDRAPPP